MPLRSLIALSMTPLLLMSCPAHATSDAATGYLVAWGAGSPSSTTGHPNYGQATPPSWLGRVKSLYVGGYHTGIVRPGGRVFAWGFNYYGETAVPPVVESPALIAVGLHHGIARLSAGNLVAWGLGATDLLLPPIDLGPVAEVSCGTVHNIAVLMDGRTVRCWGSNEHGQLSAPPGLVGVSSVFAAWYRSMAVLSSGEVRAWGYNAYGECNAPGNLPAVLRVAGGNHHSIALLSNGSVACWGSNGSGQCNVPVGLPPIAKVAGHANHSLALSVDGRVFGWGASEGRPDLVPSGLPAMMDLASGLCHAAALTCDLDADFQESPELGAFGFGLAREHAFVGLPTSASGSVEILVEAIGDLGLSSEFLNIRANGVPIGAVFATVGAANDCPSTPDRALLRIDSFTYSQLASDGTIVIRIEPSFGVDAAQCQAGSLRVSMTIPRPMVDCNGNGLNDSCDIRLQPYLDCDHDGVLDQCDGSVDGTDCDANSRADACDLLLHPGLDCDSNGLLDACEISTDVDVDCNANMILDSCELSAGAEDKDADGRLDQCERAIGDFTLDGVINGADLGVLLALWGLADPPYGDLNQNGVVDGGDLGLLLGAWGNL